MLENKFIETKTSLYRPLTKKGDPRIWIHSLKKIVSPNDIIVLIISKKILYVVNISRFSLNQICNTANPRNHIFMDLIKKGIVTMDHMISLNDKNKRIEKGPSFKIKPENIKLLIPAIEEVDLLKI